MDYASLPQELLFFYDPVAETLFAEVDYALRDGVHIQSICDPSWWEFVYRNEESLNAFYRKHLGVSLLKRGQDSESYYFLDFFAEGRRGRLSGHYKRIDNSHLLIGLLLYKIKRFDRNIELNSILEFKRILREDYQELRPGINRIARSGRQNNNHDDNDTINQMVDAAFTLFARLKWIRINNDEFDELPAFQRLIDAYSIYIQNIDQYLQV